MKQQDRSTDPGPSTTHYTPHPPWYWQTPVFPVPLTSPSPPPVFSAVPIPDVIPFAFSPLQLSSLLPPVPFSPVDIVLRRVVASGPFFGPWRLDRSTHSPFRFSLIFSILRVRAGFSGRWRL